MSDLYLKLKLLWFLQLNAFEEWRSWVCELSITEAKRLRDELDDHIGQLAGVQFVRTVTMR